MKHIWRNTWTVLDEREKKRFVALVIFDIIISISDILSLALLLWIINFYIQPADQADLSFLPAWLSDRNSLWLIAIFFVLFGIKNILAWLVSKAWYTFISNVAVRISTINLSTYQQSAFSEFTDIDSSVHMRRIGFLPFEFCQYILSGIPQIITQSSLILLTVIAILLFNAKLFLLLLLILLPPVVAIFYFIRARLIKVKSEIKAGHEKSLQHLMDALKGYVEGNIYHRNEFFLRRFTESRRKFSASMFGSLSIQGMPPRVIEIFAVLGLFILIIIAKWSGNDNTDYLVTIGAFVGAAYKIIPGIVKIINISGQVSAYGYTAAELVESKNLSNDKADMAEPVEIQSVELKNIGFRYGTHLILQDLSLSASKGDFVVISGDSGKGKTTLLNILLGFLAPTEGTVLINNQPANKENLRQYWPFISYVKQQSFLLHDTILRNITLEEDSHHKENLGSALEAAGIHKLTDISPVGLDKLITENGKNISGGQRQRIAIARALYKNANLIILDEPFNELDEESEHRMLQHFKKLSDAGKIVVLITHNKKSLAFSTKTVSLDEN